MIDAKSMVEFWEITIHLDRNGLTCELTAVVLLENKNLGVNKQTHTIEPHSFSLKSHSGKPPLWLSFICSILIAFGFHYEPIGNLNRGLRKNGYLYFDTLFR